MKQIAITLSDQIKAAEAEAWYAQSYFSKQVAAGKMKPQDAEKKIAAKKAIAETLGELQAGAPLHQLSRLRTMDVDL